MFQPTMNRLHVFADEAGCFTFERNGSASRYFILCTVAMRHCAIASDLLDLRRRLLWEGVPLGDYYMRPTTVSSSVIAFSR